MSYQLPEDINILISILNLKLRDFYTNLQTLCEDMDIELDFLMEKLEKNGYLYDPKTNQIKSR